MSSHGDAMDTDVVQRGRKKQRPAKAPAVLRGAYARVVSLDRATRDACREARPPIAPPALRKPGDDATYLDFLRRTFVAAPEPLPRDADTTAACGMDEVIVRALGYHFRTHPSPSDVLCNGARRKDPRPGWGANNRPAAGREREAREPTRGDDASREGRRPLVAPDVDIVHESAAIENLRGDTWRTYVERAGDQLAFHLLTRASVFVVAGEARARGKERGAVGYLQLCGKPVSAAARARQMADARAAKREGARRSATRVPREDAARRDETKSASERRRATRRAKERDVRALGDPRAPQPRGRRERRAEPETRGGGKGDGVAGGSRVETRETRDDHVATTPSTSPHARRKKNASGAEARPGTSAAPSSAAAKLLRRASGFVRGVITANPFMRAKPARRARDCPPRERRAAVPSPGADGGVRFFRADDDSEGRERRAATRAVSAIDVVSESAAATEAFAPCVPQCATTAAATRRRPPRPSSWRRREAARARAALASVDAGATDKVGDANELVLPSEEGGDAIGDREDSTEIVPETPDASHDSGHGSCLFASARFPRRRAEKSSLPSADASRDPDSDADSGAGWERLGAAADEEPTASVRDPRGEQDRSAHRVRAAEEARRATEEKRARLARARLEASGGEGESKPGSVSFDASAFAHKTSFARHPGLPRGHILNACGRGPRGARRLYAHVFVGRETTFRFSAPKTIGAAAAADVFPGCSAARRRGVGPPRKADVRRVPRRDREALLPLLQLMLHRARRCPYGALLDAHCPMPSGVARRLGGGETNRSYARGARVHAARRVTVDRSGSEQTGGGFVDLTSLDDADEASGVPTDADALDREEGRFLPGSETAPTAETDRRGTDRIAAGRRPNRGGPVVCSSEPGPRAAEPPSLLASFVPARAVASFLWAAIRRVAPRETLGGRRSRASLRRFLLRLTSLRRSEKCTLHEATRGVRVEEFPWLFGKRGAFEDDVARKKIDAGSETREARLGAESRKQKKRASSGRTGPATAYLARRRRLLRWYRFLVAELAVPLLRAHFYCTETEANRNRLFFYRKGVWARLTAAHLAATTEDEGGETKPPAPRRLAAAPVDPAAAATTARKPYARLRKASARYALQRHLLGFSRLRLLPKNSGLRPVAMLGRPAAASFAPPRGRHAKKPRRFPGDFPARADTDARAGGRIALAFRPVNAGLQSVFDVLRFESKRRPEVMGANVSDYHEVRARLAPFIRRWRARQRRLVRERDVSGDGSGNAFHGTKRVPETKKARVSRSRVAGPEPVIERPFIVAADVKGAFDSIPLDALERVAAALVEAPAYDVRRVTRVTGGGAGARLRAKPAREATALGSDSRDDDRERTSVFPGSGVCVDLASPLRVHRARVLELLHEHLRKNVVRSGGVYLLQKVGIPQGSVLSTLLCGVFYAHLESAHGLREGGLVESPGVGNPDPSRESRLLSARRREATDANANATRTKTDDDDFGVLCRWTDDLLYLSASRASAERFLRVVTKGFEEYGVRMHSGKTSTNFDLHETSNERRARVAWCGLLVDSETLECTVDYGRYAGDRAREAVTTPGRAGAGRASVGDPYRRLGQKVVAYLRPKAFPLLYDPSVNSPLTARVNVYQNFLMAAVKTHCYVAATTPRPSARGPTSDPPGPSAARVCAALAEGIAYMTRATERGNRSTTKPKPKTRAVARAHVRFLGLSAFLKTFSRKKTRHAGTVAALRAALATPEMRAAARGLAAVLEDPRNDVFGEIRF